MSRPQKKQSTRPKIEPRRVAADERRRMIEEAAYYKAAGRQFVGGDPVADWQQAEHEIDRILAGGEKDH